MELNKVYIENCLHTIQKMDSDFIDLIVTSPPYDEMRSYKGFSFPFKDIARALSRVLKPGGVIVWVVGDQTKDGSESLSSFKQAIYFKDMCGLNLHDTMIYEKNGTSYPANSKSNRYSQIFEFMFVFSKGTPKTHNLIKDKKNRWAGSSYFGSSSSRLKNGDIESKNRKAVVSDYGYRGNIWRYNTGFGYSTNDEKAFDHPAIFPEKLAADNIITWSNEGDLIYDPFGGSGTVAKMAHVLKRNWILSELSADYATNIINPRLKKYLSQTLLF